MIKLFEPITALPVGELHELLGASEPFEMSDASKNRRYHDWKMEIDDSPIFRYIYRNFAPGRHLEFGTWRGEGTCYVLEECGGTVWTINPALGEKSEDGEAVYGCYPEDMPMVREWGERLGLDVGDNPATDRVTFIGMKYLMRDLGSRVCQIYSDSREWDTTNYPAGFFDSVLVDGGHEEDVVLNDTRKALPLLRSGGIMMWHDFCPDHEIVRDFSTSRGVVNAMKKLIPELNQFRRVHWLEPSFILIGIKE
ncbi:MAG: class I SAM-dependent methyltransferase [Chthoniobacterales bacterium]